MPAQQWSPEALLERRRNSRRPSDAPLVWVAVATGVGFAGEHVLADWAPLRGLIFLGATLGLLVWLALWKRNQNAKACTALLVTIALGAAWWGAVAWRNFDVNDLGRFARREASPVCFEAVALASPTLRPAEVSSPFRAIPPSKRTLLKVRPVRLRDGTKWREVQGRCELVINGWAEEVCPGDLLRIYGQLSRPDPQLNPGGRDAATDARAKRELSTVWCESEACLVTQEVGADTFALFRKGYAQIHSGALKVFSERFKLHEATLAQAMILGDRSQLPREVIETFRHTGMLHLVVVSGLHVGFVALCFPLLARFGLLPMRLALVMSLILVIGYVVLVGGRPPAARAAVLATGVSIAMLCGRSALSANSLAAAAVGVFIASPGAWLGVGTQLSFLAAGTLLAVGRLLGDRRRVEPSPLDRLIDRARPAWQRMSRRCGSHVLWALAATAAVLLVTGPLVAARFHLVAPVALLLAIPSMALVAVSVLSGLFVLILDALLMFTPEVLVNFIVALPSFICQFSLKLLSQLLHAARQAPGASFYVAGPSVWWVGLWGMWIGLSLAVFSYWPRLRGVAWRLGLLVFALAFVAPLYKTLFAPDELRCSVIAVGHGSATLLQAPSGANFLCDAGSLGSPYVAADEIARALWARGVWRLDGVLLSHADVDHYNALPGLLERFPIGGVWASTQMFPRFLDPTELTGPAELKRLLIKESVPIHEVKMGDRLKLGEMSIEVLHPTDIGVLGTDNANSVVIGVEFKACRLLLTGDLEAPGLDFLLSQEPYDCDFLLAPHHGSLGSDPPGLASWCRPEWVAISSGGLNLATGLAYRLAGAQVLNTHKNGMITACIYQDQLTVGRHR